ncbi:membrane complex biogenesis BtpA family protein [Breznakia sp. PF5-3]|uniref:BtpA/SgcQ family protein n=1 Tax=unclassified Breznakia TaxID=2623764 RepID=UPI00240559AF|nr:MULTISPECIES: BtpA/SgcQ family protein [unclassified Breznakia]MDF9824743.1 membrane complex biogenesis BtpA family protein [Breznakia sp. PM6-1]MDF9835690.1 membrane complex biogenesis BtpA family protein [Breznakia sp. PF5-3]MDF9837739.1 membrane complex biogenesis BtpA family protein [Breznakia sp. PFB2-8]MDF9859700.1 membrane complex biogenesis BtpA family protein [Breznakia sp. PH5-24]
MFKPDCTVFAMIQPSPLPGSYRHDSKTIDEIVEEVLKETQMVVDNGFDGVILQNMNDMPIKQIASPEAIAYMSRIGYEIKQKYPSLTLGVLLNWDGVASLAVADAIGADFVRVEHLFTGASVTSAGILQAQCVEIANIRKRTKSKIPVYVDIQEVHGVALGAKPMEDAAWEAVHEAFADGLFISGKNVEESIQMAKAVRTKLPNTPMILGGGATGDNIYELLHYYDGVSVATWIKNGDMKNNIDPQRAEIFNAEAQRAKEDKKHRS